MLCLPQFPGVTLFEGVGGFCYGSAMAGASPDVTAGEARERGTSSLEDQGLLGAPGLTSGSTGTVRDNCWVLGV